MGFSYGQSFFQDLLHYSDEHAKDNKQLETTYALQSRAANYFKNNTFPTLYKSQKNSGMVDNKGKQDPLGGPINKLISGTNNLPGTGICSDEFDFWGKDPVPSHNEEKQDVIIENYRNPQIYENVRENIRENFGENIRENFNEDSTCWIILITVVILFLILIGYLIYQKKQ